MLRCKITPYEGTEPYVFISYAHKDAHLVYPILEELDRRGYRVWYDDGIAPGSEWPENIAQHLNGCHLTMAFLSPNSIASDNCRREVNFALSKQKAFLGVLLMPTEMSLGMEMQLSTQQCVVRHTFPSEEAFLSKVCACPDLQPCHRDGEPVPAPSAPVPKPAAQPAPTKRKLLPWIAGGCAALAIVAAILGFTLSRPKDAPPADSEQPAVSEQQQTPTAPDAETPGTDTPETETPAEQIMENPRQITLTAEDMTASEFSAAMEQVEQRISILTDGLYQLTVQDNSATVEIPHAAFCGLEESYVLRCYLSRAMELYAFNQASENPGIPEFIHLKRSDLEEVSLHEGHLPGVDTSSLNVGEDYLYLKITLTAACVETYAAELAAWGSNLAFAQDLETAYASGVVASYFTYPSEDSRTFYVINNDPGGNFSELMLHNLTNEPLSAPLTFRVVDLFDWEDPAESETPGALQVLETELTGNQMTLVYDYFDSEAALPDLLKLELAMKARFDAMGHPYSYGKKIGQNASFVFQTCADYISEDLVHLLGVKSNSLSISSDTIKLSSLGEYTLEIAEQKNGTYALRMQLELEDWSEAALILEQLTTHMLEQGQNTLYLNVDDTRFATMEITEPITDGFLLFTDCYCANLEQIDADHAYLYDLLPVLISNDHHMYELQASYVTFDPDSPMMYGLTGSASKQIVKDVQAHIATAAPQANVFENNGGLYVQLNLPVDENMVTTGTTLTKEIYELIDFPGSPYTMLLVAFTEENDAVGERCRIVFNKMYNSLYTVTEGAIAEGTIDTSALVMGGRMDEYREAVAAIFATLDFYQSMGAVVEDPWF